MKKVWLVGREVWQSIEAEYRTGLDVLENSLSNKKSRLTIGKGYRQQAVIRKDDNWQRQLRQNWMSWK